MDLFPVDGKFSYLDKSPYLIRHKIDLGVNMDEQMFYFNYYFFTLNEILSI